ncbi:MAG: hypothetical protein WB611_26815 [Stellaceae bacterium]
MPKPNIIRLGPIDNLPWAVFSDLPDHPMQRDTAVHSIKLLGSGVLHDHPMVKHDEVSIVIVGDLAAIRQRFSEVPIAALHEFAAYKENGHSRDHLSKRGEWTAPETCYAMVYAAADQKAADLSFRAVDSPTATKTSTNYLQSSLRKAGITPNSDLFRRCTGLGTALNLAISVLCGGLRYAKPKFLTQADDQVLPENLRDAETLLPYLRPVYCFKTPIEILDRLNPSSKMLPLDPGSVAAYLSILRRDPQDGAIFLNEVVGKAGVSDDHHMDPIFLLHNLAQYLDSRPTSPTPAERRVQTCAGALNAYQHWSDGAHFRPRGYAEATSQKIIADFNPELSAGCARAQSPEPRPPRPVQDEDAVYPSL